MEILWQIASYLWNVNVVLLKINGNMDDYEKDTPFVDGDVKAIPY